MPPSCMYCQLLLCLCRWLGGCGPGLAIKRSGAGRASALVPFGSDQRRQRSTSISWSFIHLVVGGANIYLSSGHISELRADPRISAYVSGAPDGTAVFHHLVCPQWRVSLESASGRLAKKAKSLRQNRSATPLVVETRGPCSAGVTLFVVSAGTTGGHDDNLNAPCKHQSLGCSCRVTRCIGSCSQCPAPP